MNDDELQEKADKLKVSIEVYKHLRSSNRKMRYFTYDIKTETIIIDGNKITILPSREDSYDWLEEQGRGFASEEKSVEDLVIESDLHLRLNEVLGQLNEGEQRLIQELFFSQGGDGKTEREAAESLGIPQKTVNNRKLAILRKLKKMIEMQK